VRVSLKGALSRAEKIAGRVRPAQFLTAEDVAAMSDEEIVSRLLELAKKVGGIDELLKYVESPPTAALLQVLRDAERNA
jgi:hypothetical protein